MINSNQNYVRISTGRVFTGVQILNLLSLVEDQPIVVASILLDTYPTDKEADDPDSKYGLTNEQN
jgi:hypothetical protein